MEDDREEGSTQAEKRGVNLKAKLGVENSHTGLQHSRSVG